MMVFSQDSDLSVVLFWITRQHNMFASTQRTASFSHHVDDSFTVIHLIAEESGGVWRSLDVEASRG